MAASPQGSDALHRPVMVEQVLDGLLTDPGGLYVDGTLGLGGHTRALLERLSPAGRVLGLELDPAAFDLATANLAGNRERLVLRRTSYADLSHLLPELGVTRCNGLLLDLGLSSFTLEQSGRGFSFQTDEPLDMRFDPGQGRPLAARLVSWSRDDIADILRQYGEERRAGAIARAIYTATTDGSLATSGDLAAAVRTVVWGDQASGTLARVFQAFRIKINDELAVLENFLPQIPALLAAGARAAIISFHSLEDRLVKRFIVTESKDCICPPELPVCRCGHTATVRAVNKKPLTPSAAELDRNPRSRSAKLRIFERLP